MVHGDVRPTRESLSKRVSQPENIATNRGCSSNRLSVACPPARTRRGCRHTTWVQLPATAQKQQTIQKNRCYNVVAEVEQSGSSSGLITLKAAGSNPASRHQQTSGRATDHKARPDVCTSGTSSTGRAPAFQAGGYGLGSRVPLQTTPDAGWRSLVAHWSHKPKVAGSNPAPATTSIRQTTTNQNGLSNANPNVVVAQLAEHPLAEQEVGVQVSSTTPTLLPR